MGVKVLIAIIAIVVVMGSALLLLTYEGLESHEKQKGTILYVGGSGLCNYSSIQAAIDAAYDNYTIFIYPGIYSEHLIISKPLRIYGKSAHNTTIDLSYNGTGVTIISHDVIIGNLHMRNAGGKSDNTLINILKGETEIHNCIFERARHGILLAKKTRAVIHNCTFYHIAIGIRAVSTINTFVAHCSFIKNGIGILFTESSHINIGNIWGELNGITIMNEKCNNVKVANCILFNGNENQVNLYAERTNDIFVENCTIYHSGRGIRLRDCANAIVKNTHLYDSKIGIETSDLSSLHIEGSRIHNNDVGIYLYLTDNIIIQNNEIYDNSVANLAGEKSSGYAQYNWWGKYLGAIRTVYSKGGRIVTFPSLKQKPLQVNEDTIFVTTPKMPVSNPIIFSSSIDNDTDGDGTPDWWEKKYGYSPLVKDDHYSLDPDQDGLDNIEEYLTNQWGSNPYTKDLFVEIDSMDESYELSEKKMDKMREKFASHGITLHVDSGSMKRGQIVDKADYVNFVSLIDLYWEYFLHNNPTYWRKGIFHYVLLSDSLLKGAPGFVFIGWDEADAFALSMGYYEGEIPQLFRPHVLATVFMHELGHTLGLFHDVYPGIDNESSIIPFIIPLFKGQIRYMHYRSCMNYQFAWQVLDYSDGNNGRRNFDDWSHINLTFFQNSHWGQ